MVVPANISAGTVVRGSIVHASQGGSATNSRGHTEEDISRLQSAINLYNAGLTYEIGDIVKEGAEDYRNTTAITVPEAFNAANWELVGAQTPVRQDVDYADFNILNSGFLEQNEITEPADPAAGLLRLWPEEEEGFSILKYKGSNGFVNTISQDVFVAVRNRSGSTILQGKVVYIDGAQGNRPTIQLAQANSSATMRSIGFVLEDIGNNSNGFVIVAGTERDINTNAFTEGDTLYVSPTTAGEITATEPVHPDVSQVVGFILSSNPTTGEINVIPGDTNGEDEGTNKNSFLIGDGLTGTKELEFVNDLGTLTVEANPTTDRTQTLQDASGEIALVSDVFKFILKRQLLVAPSAGTEVLFVGLGAGTPIVDGALSSTLDGDGYYLEFAATAGMMEAPGGLLVADSVRGDLNFDVVFKFRLNQLANGLFACGFFELDALNNPLATNEHFGLIRDDGGANTNFLISHSDGVTLTQTQVGVEDANIHTIRLKSDDANSKYQYAFDSVDDDDLVDVTTNIPAFTTNLILFEEYEDTTGGAGVTVDVWYIDGVVDV